jgi:formylglycine-generating enzyme required for sulfatase activity
MAIRSVRRPVPLLGPTLRAGVVLGACASLLPALPAAAAQQDAAVVSVERLRFEKKCFYGVDEWRGKGEDSFLVRLKAQHALYAAKPDLKAKMDDLETLLAETLWNRSEAAAAAGNMDGATAIAAEINRLGSSRKEVKDLQAKARDLVIRHDLDKARAFKAAGRPAEARAKFVNTLVTEDPALFVEIVGEIVAIDKGEEYDAILKGDDLEKMAQKVGEVLASLEAGIPAEYRERARKVPAYAALEKDRAEVAGLTQVLNVSFLDVAASVTGAHDALDPATATFTLTPVAEGKPYPKTGPPGRLPARFTWHKGVYDVRAFGPGSETAAVVLRKVALQDAPGSVAIPNRVPKGMVWVPASPAGPGFFIDRHEVTVGAVKAAGGDSNEVLKGVLELSNKDDGAIAWFETEAMVLEFEKASGKRIPTAEQWLQAAFGGNPFSTHPYPWGKDAPTADHAFLDAGAEEPKPAGGRPAGASPCGAEDMAGNVSEWVRAGGSLWLLGGHYALGAAKISNDDGRDHMRMPMPGETAFGGLGIDVQKTLGKFKYKPEDFSGYATGLRMVLPVQGK